jgi:hypothetical protein
LPTLLLYFLSFKLLILTNPITLFIFFSFKEFLNAIQKSAKDLAEHRQPKSEEPKPQPKSEEPKPQPKSEEPKPQPKEEPQPHEPKPRQSSSSSHKKTKDKKIDCGCCVIRIKKITKK